MSDPLSDDEIELINKALWCAVENGELRELDERALRARIDNLNNEYRVLLRQVIQAARKKP